MDRSLLIEMVARTRQAASECERLIVAQAEKIRGLQASGDSTTEVMAVLSQLESEYDRHMIEMERLLDELDKIGEAASPG
jgi:3-methyladenine DNA glycosylase AlkC